MEIIARIRNDFPTKFGLPRQSGLVSTLKSTIVFEEPYRVPEALRGLDGYTHLWQIWEFSEAKRDSWSPTVRPPRLGGNVRMGVFATRSPFRPNPVGLSCVKLEAIERRPGLGDVLIVSGADLMDGTPIYDIKPYLPYVDCHPEARGGFADEHIGDGVEVVFPEEHLQHVPESHREALHGILAQDPRPAYQKDPDRVYGFAFAGMEIRFTVRDGVLTVCGVEQVSR